MKKKIANIVELVLAIATLVVFFTMQGTATIDGGHHYYHGSIANALNQVKVYAIPLYVLWGLNILMCVFGALSKSKKRDGATHVILPILLFLFTNFAFLSVAEEANGFLTMEALMFAMIIAAFVKRSRAIVGEAPETVIVANAPASSADELKKYKDLLDAGAISQDEYEAKKKQLLGL